MLGMKAHWEAIYKSRKAEETSWYEKRPATSLRLVSSCNLAKTDAILDVGGGASSFAECLLRKGFSDLTVLDLSEAALAKARRRLGRRARQITWRAGSVLDFRPRQKFSLWHDRAVFHFFTRAADRKRYLRVLKATLSPGGFVILAAFGPKGPQKCSGLPVRRYGVKAMQRALGREFKLQKTMAKAHRTPWNTLQNFQYFLFRLNLRVPHP